jgi:signal transduction histidine kinase
MQAPAMNNRRLGAVISPILEIVLPVVIVGCIVLAAHEDYAVGPRPLDVTGGVIIVVANLPLVARRRAPVLVLLTCCAGLLAYTVAGYWEALNSFGSLVAVYTVAACRPRRTSAPLAALDAVLLAITAISAHAGPVWLLIALAAPFSLTAWMIGDVRRMLTERNQQLAALTEQLDRDRMARAQRAVVEERVRIARELHDMVAHHMSVVSVQAGLAQYLLESEPATARRALETVLTATAEGLDEMRRLLRLLRLPPETSTPDSPEQPYDPTPSLRRLGELVDRVRAAGVPVDLSVTGTQRTLPPGVDLCVYRVIQESLTNVLKHARPAHATVAVHYAPGQLSARITDDGAGLGLGPGLDTTGHGLSGMRERTGLYGGTLVAGPRAEGGFEVALVLPLTATVDGEAPGAD